MDMSSAQAILDKILGDAHEFASAATRDAHERASVLQAEADARLETRRSQTREQAERDADQAVKRAWRMAELEERKAILQTRREVMDIAFDRALDTLRALPVTQKRAYFLRAVLDCAEGGELVRVGDLQPEWYDDGFLTEVNGTIAQKGLRPLTKAPDTFPQECGLVLERGGAQIILTFESAIHSRRLSLEADVARLLFPE